MYGLTAGGWPVPPAQDDTARDPMTQPLPPTPPPSWTGREDRVRWCIENLTAGEQALLYKVLYEAGLRRDQCQGRIEKEKKACSS